MGDIKNVLFIMCDQLRWDYLSCYGHPHLHTPNIDWLASQGVRFNKAYVQSPICGPSRMSFYTGRYVISHGSTWNDFPLKVGELTLGDHLRPLGVDTVLIGKTHMKADKEGMERYGIDEDTIIGNRLAECGFDVFERDDGLHPDGNYAPSPRYNDYLQEKGYADPNPWNTRANGVKVNDDKIGLGWFLKYSSHPANIAEEDSETPYLTSRFMDFIDSRKTDSPWLCHLSFIKPHWPYIVPAPYHNMYGPDTWLPPVRSEDELRNPHPVYKAFTNSKAGKSFSRDEVRNTVLPAYMGLIKQIDDQMGRLFSFLQERDLMDKTMIIFTSDHGDYLGDHWLGEKDLFHEPSVRVPLIIYDPRTQADLTRGTVSNDLVEAIDLVPTFIESFGGSAVPHKIEGKSLMPLLHGQSKGKLRNFAFSEYDYSMTSVRKELGTGANDSRLIMVTDGQWKYVHAENFRPMLLNLQEDPDELIDLGSRSDFEEIRDYLSEAIFEWSRRQRQRITVGDDHITCTSKRRAIDKGILVGFWTEEEVDEFK